MASLGCLPTFPTPITRREQLEKDLYENEQLKTLQLDLQEEQGRALFFANEVYLTPGAAEQIVLNAQMGYEIDLKERSVASSLSEQVPFINEQIAHNSDNFGRVLWKTSKYLERMADGAQGDAIRKLLENSTSGQALLTKLESMRQAAVELKKIKKGDDVYSGLTGRDRAARHIAGQHSEQLGSNVAEFQDKVNALHIELQLEIQRHTNPPLPQGGVSIEQRLQEGHNPPPYAVQNPESYYYNPKTKRYSRRSSQS